MKSSWLIWLLSSALFIAAIVSNPSEATSWQSLPSASPDKEADAAPGIGAMPANLAATVSYRINPGQSRFMVTVGSSGLLWFLGHTHHFAVRDFSGEATFTTGSLTPASLQMTIQAASLAETGENFTEAQKQIINQQAHNAVLETNKYPEIIFKSTTITGKMKSEGLYEVKIAGNLTLHGVTRLIEIPAQVKVDGNSLQATGVFSINRSDYNVKTKSIKSGTIRVRNKVTFEFEIMANKV